MKTQDKTGVIFVNTVLGRGILNGVINISFSTFNFSPDGENGIDADPVVSCRLRMDRTCLEQLHGVTRDLLAAIEAAEQAVEKPPIKAKDAPKREKAH